MSIRKEGYKMIGIYYNAEGIGGVCYSYPELYRETFSPEEWNIVILDKLTGSYNEKQAALREKAIATQQAVASLEYIGYNELIDIEQYFTKYGKRYGLMRELKENGVI